jgi:hypothetical protein
MPSHFDSFVGKAAKRVINPLDLHRRGDLESCTVGRFILFIYTHHGRLMNNEQPVNNHEELPMSFSTVELRTQPTKLTRNDGERPEDRLLSKDFDRPDGTDGHSRLQ